MKTLQTMACRSYLENCKIGTKIPYEIPGSAESWIIAWMDLMGLEDRDNKVCDLIVECLNKGSATRTRIPYSLRKRTEIMSDTIGINRGPHVRSNLSDIIIILDPDFSWRKKKFTSSILDKWNRISSHNII